MTQIHYHLSVASSHPPILIKPGYYVRPNPCRSSDQYSVLLDRSVKSRKHTNGIAERRRYIPILFLKDTSSHYLRFTSVFDQSRPRSLWKFALAAAIADLNRSDRHGISSSNAGIQESAFINSSREIVDNTNEDDDEEFISLIAGLLPPDGQLYRPTKRYERCERDVIGTFNITDNIDDPASVSILCVSPLQTKNCDPVLVLCPMRN